MALSARSAFVGGFVLWAAPALVWRALLLIGVGSWTTIGMHCLIAFLAIAVALLGHDLRTHPRAGPHAAAITSAGLGVFIGICFVGVVSSTWRMTAFRWATHRAQPLVAAIERYERENGNPPPDLNALVPQYLDRLPGRLPPFKLVVTNNYPPNEWILKADVSSGISNWDALLFLPHENYEDFEWGGWIRRLDAWGYLHE